MGAGEPKGGNGGTWRAGELAIRSPRTAHFLGQFAGAPLKCRNPFGGGAFIFPSWQKNESACNDLCCFFSGTRSLGKLCFSRAKMVESRQKGAKKKILGLRPC